MKFCALGGSSGYNVIIELSSSSDHEPEMFPKLITMNRRCMSLPTCVTERTIAVVSMIATVTCFAAPEPRCPLVFINVEYV